MMNIYKLLLYFYPRAWRTRYEEEFLVVLASHPISFFEGIDVVRGALDAHLHPRLGTIDMSLPERMRQMLFTLRNSLLTIFCAYIGFILAGAGFQKMTEDASFQQVVQTSSTVGLTFHLVVIGAFVALLAVLIGGLPIAGTIIRFALARKRYGPLLLLVVPILACMVFFLTTMFLEAIDHQGIQSVWQFHLHQGLFFGTLTTTVIASTGAVCLAVARSEIPEKLLRFALLPCTLSTVSMALVLAAIFIWGLGMHVSAPQLFAGNAGIVRTSTIGTWLGIVITMTIATGLSTLSLQRGLAARSALPTTAA